ncbi:MAG: TonB-dependent receptor plug domain-containing protein, partial [Synergistales bacterium]|nr:TonB-dependent receptor plug domain-containing protein [Synergistales bacterium]
MRKVSAAVSLLVTGLFFLCAGSRFAWAETVFVEPEVVTGSRIYTELSEVPAPTYVITAEEIAVSGAMDLGTLLDRNVPGIFMKKKTGVSQQSEVVIRGITTEILVLVDGIPYYRSSHLADGATVDLRSFPLENIERIEIVKGGGSAIYGSMAAGGVLNIITKKTVAPGGMILAEAGSNDWRRYYVSGNAVGGDLSAGIWYERIDEGRKR